MPNITPYPEFAPVAIVSAFLPLLCIPWHWQARNVATLSLTAWLIITNLIYGIDAILWSNNFEIKAVIWCDISTKIIVGANVALPSACFCVALFVEHTAAARTHQFIIGNKKHRDIFEFVMSVGLPMIFMALHYVVQGHRFDILKGYGCRPTTYFSTPAILIVWIPPLLLSFGTLICAVSSLRYIITRRGKPFHALPLNLSNPFNVRLMIMVILELIWTITLTSFILGFNMSQFGLKPWDTWDNVHFNFSRIDVYDMTLAPELARKGMYLIWWVLPISTCIFVAFFAFGSHAMVQYKRCFWCVWSRFSNLMVEDRWMEKGESSTTSIR